MLDDDGNAHSYVKLKRALYGLKQAPQLWNKELTKCQVQHQPWGYAGKRELIPYTKTSPQQSQRLR